MAKKAKKKTTKVSAPTPKADSALLSSLKGLLRPPFREWKRPLLRGLVPTSTNLIMHDFLIKHDDDDAAEGIKCLTEFLRVADFDIGCDWEKVNGVALESMSPRLCEGTCLADALAHLDPFRWLMIQLMQKYERLGEAIAVEQCYKLVQGGRARAETRDNPAGLPHQQLDPNLYLTYGMALYLAGNDDAKATKSLEDGLQYFTLRDEANAFTIFESKCTLVTLYNRTGDKASAERTEEEMIRFLRVNPQYFSQNTIENVLFPNFKLTDSFLKKYSKAAHKMEDPANLTKSTNCCYNCFSSGAGSKLLKCSKCQVATYCGRQCQVADWKHHKEKCMQQFALLDGNKLRQDFSVWVKLVYGVVEQNFASALDLQSDFDRIDNYCLFISAKWHPELNGVEKFEIVKAEPRLILELCRVGLLDLESAFAGRARAEAQGVVLGAEKEKWGLVNVRIAGESSFGVCQYLSMSKSMVGKVDPDWKGNLKRRVVQMK